MTLKLRSEHQKISYERKERRYQLEEDICNPTNQQRITSKNIQRFPQINKEIANNPIDNGQEIQTRISQRRKHR